MKSVEVPFVVLGDGRKVLTSHQMFEDPSLFEFYKHFKHCFTPLWDMDAVQFNDPKERIWDAIKDASR